MTKQEYKKLEIEVLKSLKEELRQDLDNLREEIRGDKILYPYYNYIEIKRSKISNYKTLVIVFDMHTPMTKEMCNQIYNKLDEDGWEIGPSGVTEDLKQFTLEVFK